MRPEQWQLFKKAAKRQAVDEVPVALIVDSPWIPGHLGISHLDYFFDPETWLQANLKVARAFPKVTFFPSWWVEYGMAIEPSAAGARMSFYDDRTPDVRATLLHLEDVRQFAAVDACHDGLMAMALRQYRTCVPRIVDEGYTVPVVAARGPLCTAAYLHDVNNLMLNMVEDPEGVHRLLQFTTAITIAWLRAQAEAIGPSVECIFVLDDIPGFLSRRLYNEFAHPYMKQICDAFPAEWVKVYHNDASIQQFLTLLPDTGFDVLNFTHNLEIADAAEKTGGRLCLMGNVSPLELGVRGTPEEVKAAAVDVLRKTGGRNLILSMGGGVSPGTPAANIEALVEAAGEFRPLPSAG